jgi:hypothetical protein
MPHDVEKIIRRFNDLQSARKNWDSHWHEIAELVWPAADDFVIKREPGAKRSREVYDATATMALEKFAAVMESLLTPRAQTWHRLRASNEELNKDQDVKAWFEEVTRILFAKRNAPKANYYSQKHEGYKSLGAFGNDCLFVDELEPGPDQPEVGIRYKYCHIGQVFIETDHHGVVDTVFRKYEMSAKAAAQKWGTAIPSKMSTVLEQKPYQKFGILHVVAPRKERNLELVDPLNKPFLSLYISMEDKAVIEESGYEEMPYMYSRYTVNPMEVYGRSPAMLVLPSIKTAQEMQKTFLRAGHKVVDPPLLLHSTGGLGGGSQTVRLTAGGLNYGGLTAEGRPLIAPLLTGARLDLTEGMLEKERLIINAAFLVDLFQILQDHPEMTATEVIERAQEKGQFLAPTVGRQQSEMLGPQIVREVNILVRTGQLPELPGLLLEAGGKYEIEYESDATRFQQAAQLGATDRTVQRAMLLGEFDQRALDVINGEEVVRLSGRVERAPSEIFRTPEEVDERAQAREEAQQAAAALEAGERLARAGKDAAQAEAVAPETLGGAGAV